MLHESKVVLFLLFPVIGYVLVYFQDADFTLLLYKTFGQNPTTMLHGKVVWVTGASSGIGEHLAYELAKHGARLILSARKKDELERVKKRCVGIALKHHKDFKENEDIISLPLDLREYNSHQELARKVMDHFGKIDVLLNNAGRSQRGAIENTSLEVDRAIFDLNTIGTISLTKAVLPSMLQRRDGQIVVISSNLGKQGDPRMATYSASKHALQVQGYFDALRLETFKRNINVLVVCPGPVKANVAANAFTESLNVAYGDTPEFKDPMYRMPTERCAELTVTAIANRFDEVWISPHPTLGLTYLRQYLPCVHLWYSKWLASL